jgi:hypothetical protein
MMLAGMFTGYLAYSLKETAKKIRVKPGEIR